MATTIKTAPARKTAPAAALVKTAPPVKTAPKTSAKGNVVAATPKAAPAVKAPPATALIKTAPEGKRAPGRPSKAENVATALATAADPKILATIEAQQAEIAKLTARLAGVSEARKNGPTLDAVEASASENLVPAKDWRRPFAGVVGMFLRCDIDRNGNVTPRPELPTMRGLCFVPGDETAESTTARAKGWLGVAWAERTDGRWNLKGCNFFDAADIEALYKGGAS